MIEKIKQTLDMKKALQLFGMQGIKNPEIGQGGFNYSHGSLAFMLKYVNNELVLTKAKWGIPSTSRVNYLNLWEELKGNPENGALRHFQGRGRGILLLEGWYERVFDGFISDVYYVTKNIPHSLFIAVLYKKNSSAFGSDDSFCMITLPPANNVSEGINTLPLILTKNEAIEWLYSKDPLSVIKRNVARTRNNPEKLQRMKVGLNDLK